MRVVHLSHDMEAIGRLFSPERGARGRPRSPRPHLRPGARRPLRRARRGWFDRLARARAVGRGARPRARAPPHRWTARTLDAALTVAADFIDLKSPYMAGHSRRCARARRRRGPRPRARPRRRVTALRRAALVHDFGTTASRTRSGTSPGPLTRTEFDRVELHPMLTEQMLRRSPALAGAEPGRGRATTRSATGRATTSACGADTVDPAACVLAATDVYVGLTTERADRPRLLGRRGRRRAAPSRGARACSSRARPTRCSWPPATASRRPRTRGGRSTRADSPAARSRCCASPRAG